MSRSGLVGLKSALAAIVIGVLYLVLSRTFDFGSEGLFSLMVITVFVASSSAYKSGVKDQRAGRGE